MKRMVGAGVLAGVGYAVWRAWKARVPESSGEIEWRTAPFPFPPVPRPRDRTTVADWVEPPNGTGACPITHPIKGKRSSGIYHVPGGANYDRTIADRCYVNEEAAERDGMRRSKF